MLSDLILQHPAEVFKSVIISLIALAIYQFVIFPLYFHPLASIPGPKICALTKYYILYISWSEQRNRFVHNLHLKYGPIVRIGPDEIDISDSEYLRDIYVNNFDKTSFYTQFQNFGSFNTFSTVDKDLHRISRKISHKFYSKTTIASKPIQDKIEKVMSKSLKVLSDYSNQTINTFIFFQEIALDGVNSFAFGENNYKSVLNDPFGEGQLIVESFLKQGSSWFWTTSMPQWYNYAVKKEVFQASKRVTTWLKNQFESTYSNIQLMEKQNSVMLNDEKPEYVKDDSPVADSNNKNALISVLLDGGKSANASMSEMYDHVAAGHNTSGTTLAYFFWRCANHPDVQDQLIREIKDFNQNKNISKDDYSCFKYKDIENLPYMNAVLMETFRLHSAIPGQEPRLVPEQGLRWRGSKEVKPCLVPSKTVVTMQPYSLHRDPAVFANPDEFDVTRWLVDPSKPNDYLRVRELHRHMMHFGSGVRMCVGLNLAICEIKLIICNILARYRVELVEGVDYKSTMRMRDTYTTGPFYNVVDLRFKPILED